MGARCLPHSAREALWGGGRAQRAGRRQAVLLGERLKGVPFPGVLHGPLVRAEETARLVREELGVAVRPSEAAGDFVPCGLSGVPGDKAAMVASLLEWTPDADLRLAEQALSEFTGAVEGDGDRYELVVTRNFLIGWLVRAAPGAPEWWRIGRNHANAALTVIRYAPGKADSVLCFNDMSHLPDELQWTGFPPELRI